MAAKLYREMVAVNQRKDQFWVQISKMMDNGRNSATIEMNLENFYDEL